jgi:hypothetical protein
MAQFLLGAIAFGSALAALNFLRFWRQTRDRFFLLFALSFLLEALGRVVLAVYPQMSEDNPAFYLGRVIAYGLILSAIWLKNRPRR